MIPVDCLSAIFSFADHVAASIPLFSSFASVNTLCYLTEANQGNKKKHKSYLISVENYFLRGRTGDFNRSKRSKQRRRKKIFGYN
jgi:hypothetical protein